MALVFAVMHLYNTFYIILLLLSIPFTYVYIFLKSGIDKSTEWSTIPACLSLRCFLNRGDIKGTNSLKVLSFMFMYVLCRFVSGLIFWFMDNLWFDDLHAE